MNSQGPDSSLNDTEKESALAIPNYQSLMLPVLKYLFENNGQNFNKSNLLASLSKQFNLNENEITALLPSGKQRILDNRTQWAMFYLFKAGLLSHPKRGQYTITEEGTRVLSKGLAEINVKYLRNFEPFRQFVSASREDATDTEEPSNNDANPEESLERNYERYKSSIFPDLISKVRLLEPEEFELLIIALLKKMGYGVGNKSVTHLGKTGDGGVDGEISQDALGLEKIYIQAKRFGEGNPVGRPAIQQFVGSLNERKSKKGIFITSSSFSKEARDYTNKIDMVVRLIDGSELAELMYKYDIGVETKVSYQLKVINDEFFESL